MATRQLYEDDVWTVVARHKLGKLEKKEVTLVFKKVKADKSETDLETVKTKIDKELGEIRHQFTAPKVADDEPSYRLVVDCEFHKYIGKDKAKRIADDCVIWPRTFQIQAKDQEGKNAFEGFDWTAKQGVNAPVNPPKTRADGKSSFDLKKDKAPDAVQSVTPYEIVESKKEGTKLRSLQLKVRRNFTPELVLPRPRDDGKPHKQFVNLDTASEGQDKLGHTITLEVGVKADDAGKKAKKGDTIYIQVKFGRESKRNLAKPALLAPAQEVAESDAGKTFKGKVVITADEGTAKFKVEVGIAGGDTTQVFLSSVKDRFAGAPDIEFVNWRKIWYEVMAPECITLDENVLEDGVTKVKAFNAGAAGNLKTQGDSVFVVFEPYKSFSFTEAEANTAGAVGTFLPREFFELAGGHAKRYLLTDFTFTKYPKNFDKGKGRRAALIKACDINLFNDGPGSDADKLLSVTAEAADQAKFDVFTAHRVYWSPKSAFSGGAAADSVRELKWEAVITAASVKRKPAVALGDDVPTPPDPNLKLQTVTIRETHQNASHTVKFQGAGEGEAPTQLSPAETSALDAWLRSLCTVPKLRPSKNELKFVLSGAAQSVKNRARLAEVRSALPTRAAAVCPEVAVHPGLDDAGQPRKGNLGAAGADMTKSTWKVLFVKLPAANDTDPGKFIGAAGTEDKCPVKLDLKYEPQHGGMGMAGQGAQAGELLFRYDPANPVASTDIMLHELGHQFAMTPYNVAADGFAPGMRKAKDTTQDEDLDPYKSVGAKGHYYNAHGHSGSHCAWSLSDAHKALASYKGRSGKCIMYGEAPGQDARRYFTGFCPQCIDYIKARDLSALS